MSIVAHRFYVLEGLDAAGKTSVASLLGDWADLSTIETPSPPLGEVKEGVLEFLPPVSRLLYFMAANFDIADRYVRSNPHQTVLVTRYIWSTIAYHAAIEDIPVSVVVQPLKPLLERLLLPEKVVFLKVGRAEQIRRMRMRNEAGLGRRLGLSDEFYSRLSRAYDATFSIVQVPTVPIDTTELSIGETLNRVRSELRVPEEPI
jgi:thymidylate kinase